MAFKRVGLLMLIATGLGTAVLFVLHSESDHARPDPPISQQLTERDPVGRLHRSK